MPLPPPPRPSANGSAAGKRRVTGACRNYGGLQELSRAPHHPLRRIRHQEGLLRRKRRKHRVKRDLRAVKAAWRLWEQIDLDTKDLDDIPQLWPQIRRLGLPLIQHTARETGWKNPTALITWSWKWSPAKLELSASSTMEQSPLRKHYALLVAIDCWLDY